MSNSKITLGPEQVSVDQHGRKIFARAVKVGGVVQGVIVAEPKPQQVKGKWVQGWELVGSGVSVTIAEEGKHRIFGEYRHFGFSSRGPATEWDHFPTAEEVTDNALSSAAYNDGFGWAKYAAQGSPVPEGVHPAFLEGAKAFSARNDGARPVRDGVLTGKPWGSSF